LGALRVIFLLAVLLSPAALRSVTVARVPILRLSWRMRKLRRDSVNPLAPFAAISVPVEGQTIGVVRVAESSDTHTSPATG